ncbi:hypothetical protein BC941DRAFT_437313 [Chlamydoabsidia padenii]|nr:hypothetical protein BC941DRAFT_437313 [Chlamydoabsidia padenii]
MKSTSTYTTMMRVTPDGRPFARDLHDIFAAMIFQIKIGDHRSLFRTYPASFTTEEMIEVLDHLQFTHVLRQPDPQDANKQLETKTITTFSMARTMAKQLGQHFITARLIESASDPTGNRTMKDRGIWTVTSKGKWMVYNFAERGHVAWHEQSETRQALKTVPDRTVVLLDRCDFSHDNRSLDGDSENSNKKDVDVISFERQNMTDAFRSMMEHLETSQLLADDVGGLGSQQMGNYTHTFFGYHVVDYIGQFMSVVNRDEAGMVASEFVLYGWISQVLDKSDRSNSVKSDLLFKSQRNVIYALTDRGRAALGWDDRQQRKQMNPRLAPSSSDNSNKKKSQHQQPPVLSDAASTMSSSSLASLSSASSISSSTSSSVQQQQQQHKQHKQQFHRHSVTVSTHGMAWLDPASAEASYKSTSPTVNTKSSPVFVPSPRTCSSSSHYIRLQPILEDPLLRMYFREFLKQNFCEENLHFWVDYRNMLYHHQHQHKTSNSSTTCNMTTTEKETTNTTTSSTDYNRILSECYAIYVTYLAPQATMELNIDHTLHQDILRFVEETFKVLLSDNDTIIDHQKRHPYQPLPFFYTPTHPTQEQQTIIMVNGHRSQCLKILLAMYERVHDQVCRIMAEDSLPRFLKSPRYVEWQERQKKRQEMELLAQQEEEQLQQDRSSFPKDRVVDDLKHDDGYDSDVLNKELDRLTLTGVATTKTTTTTAGPKTP